MFTLIIDVMKKIFLIAAVAAVCLCACAKKEEPKTGDSIENAGVVETVAESTGEYFGPDSEKAKTGETEEIEVPELTQPETTPIADLSEEDIKKLTSSKWKETTNGISIMRLDKEGTGEFENASLGFEWSYDGKIVTILIGQDRNIEPILLELSEENGKAILTQTNGDAIFEKE